MVSLNVDIKHGNYPSALFCYAGDVTIKDLHLTGKINGGMHSAGLIGIAQAGTPTITINRVWVSTEVNTTASHAGGIIGHADRGNVYMNDCLFDGTVKTNNADGSFIGCIIGWANTPGSWCLDRVYNNPSTIPLAQRIYLCLYHHGTWKRWGSSERSFTISSINWSDWEVNHYNKKDQNEVLRLMNNRKPNSWTLYDGKAVPIMNGTVILSGYTEILEGSSNGYALSTGRYYITKDLTFSNNKIGGSGISINSDATVHIYVPQGVTLTAIGHDASGQDGAGAGILLPQGSTLFLEGNGTVVAKGGRAANGGNGGNGTDGTKTNFHMRGGHGGSGGDGGGGAGAGIGTSGGTGGKGANGVTSRSECHYTSNQEGVAGNQGNRGGNAAAMGTLFVYSGGVQVNATGGDKGSGGSGGSKGWYMERNTGEYNQHASGGGGGGGGAGGGSAEGIGTGGPGGGGGGSGAAGSCTAAGDSFNDEPWDFYSLWAKGGTGGRGSDGNNGSTGAEAGQWSNWKSANNYSHLSKDGGGGGNPGEKSQSCPTIHEYFATFNAVSNFGGKVDKSCTIGYKSNDTNSKITINVPPFNVLGITDRERYVIQWNDRNDGGGKNYKVYDEIQIYLPQRLWNKTPAVRD